MYATNKLVIGFIIFEYVACPVQGQVRSRCASDPSCHVTCEDRFIPRPCPRICVVGGCECPRGTVINKNLNMCVLLEECPTSMYDVQPYATDVIIS